MAHVKFYSVAADATKSDTGGIYFVTGGELYKGTSRFGANKVWTVPSNATITGETEEAKLSAALTAASVTGQISGDILTGYGAAKVFNGTTWVDLGQDEAALTDQLKELVSGLAFSSDSGSYITGITQDPTTGKVTVQTENFKNAVLSTVGNSTASGTSNGVTVSVTTTSGKVTAVEVEAPAAKTWTAINVGDANSYIYNVTQGTDGQVSASAAAFPTLATGDAAGQVKLGSTNATVNGWSELTGSVSDLESRVSDIEGIVDASTSTVTATTGNFTNLVVSDTATFSATTVSASTLTVGGVAVSNISATDASDNDSGIAVTVSTANGGVTGVDVVVTSATLLTSLALTDFAGKSVVTALGPSTGEGAATDTQVPTALAVAKKLATLDNAMHFKGAGTALPASPVAGDVYVFTGNATDESGYKTGQEVVYTGSDWEVIGDQNTYAVNAYTSTASVYTGVSTVAGALDAVGAAAATFQAAPDAKVTTAASVSDAGEASNLVTAGAVAGYVAQEITALNLGTAATKNYADSLTSTGASLPTESAVAGYVTGVVESLDASVSSSENNSIQVGVTQVDGVVTGVTADLVWLGADGNALT